MFTGAMEKKLRKVWVGGRLALGVQFCGWPALCALGAGGVLLLWDAPANATRTCAAAAAPQTPAPSCQQGPGKQETSRAVGSAPKPCPILTIAAID